VVHCPPLKANKAEPRVVANTGITDKTPLESSRDSPMSTKRRVNVSCDALEYTAVGGGKCSLIAESLSLSGVGKLFLQEQHEKKREKSHGTFEYASIHVISVCQTSS